MPFEEVSKKTLPAAELRPVGSLAGDEETPGSFVDDGAVAAVGVQLLVDDGVVVVVLAVALVVALLRSLAFCFFFCFLLFLVAWVAG